MTTWLVAIVGGGIGTVVGWLIAYAGRLSALGREIAANDRALRVIDDHLETWVGDDTVRLRRELREISETLNKGSLFWSGHHGRQIALAKERALQAYRDQEPTARSEEADIGAREGRWHSLLRAWKKRDFGLSAPERVKSVLDAWAAPVTRHLGLPASLLRRPPLLRILPESWSTSPKSAAGLTPARSGALSSSSRRKYSRPRSAKTSIG